MNPSNTSANGYRSRTRTNTLRLLGWNGAWLAATVLMKFGPKSLWNQSSVFTLLAVGLDVAVGVGMILATKKYVMELDELQQRVWLNALGITVGVAVIAVPPLSVMDVSHMLSFHMNISHVVMLMAVTFVVSFLYGTWRYR